MGITLLISTLVGKVAGMLPDFVSEFITSREHNREKDMLQTQTEMQIKLTQANVKGELAKLDAETQIQSMQMQSSMLENQTKLAIAQANVKTGIKWVDAFNALMRPTFVSVVMILFITTAGFYVYGVMTDESLTSMQKSTLIWQQSLIGTSIEAVIGFLFGYRSTKKRSGEK